MVMVLVRAYMIEKWSSIVSSKLIDDPLQPNSVCWSISVNWSFLWKIALLWQGHSKGSNFIECLTGW